MTTRCHGTKEGGSQRYQRFGAATSDEGAMLYVGGLVCIGSKERGRGNEGGKEHIFNSTIYVQWSDKYARLIKINKSYNSLATNKFQTVLMSLLRTGFLRKKFGFLCTAVIIRVYQIDGLSSFPYLWLHGNFCCFVFLMYF